MVNKKLSAVAADALVLGCAQTDSGPVVISDGVEPVDPTLLATVSSLGKQLGITGAPDDVHKFPGPAGYQAKMLVLTGLGKADPSGGFSAEALRRAACAAARACAGTASVAMALPTPDGASLAAVAEGALLGAYAFNKFRDPEQALEPPSSISVVSQLQRSTRAQAAFDQAQVIAGCVAAARDLVDTPPNLLYTQTLAEAAVAQAKGFANLKVTVLDEKQLQAGGYVGLVAVGQGSPRGPRLVKLEYYPPGAVGKVGLVGKGITFDSGGISLKPAAKMGEMTLDMSGAAAVLETVIAAAKLALPVAVLGYMCCAENMPGGNAQRPGDIIKYRNGKTAEVANTDAEGRLVMADGLIDAVAAGVDVVVDIATLTGAQIVALGHRTSAVMGTDSVRTALVAAADASGELFWPMPIPSEMKAELKTPLADMANVSSDRAGGMLYAAAFLREFVGDTPWGHLDIASPAFNGKAAWGYTPQGGTGVGVRTLVQFLQDFANHPGEFA